MYRDVAIATIFLALSAAMFALTFTFPDQTIALPPTAFPRFVTVCMAALSVLLMVRAWRGRADGPKPGAPSTLKDAARSHLGRIVALAVLCLVYTQAVGPLGYLLSTGLFLAAAVVLFMDSRLKVVVPVAVLGCGALYWVFRVVFKVPLPRFDLF